jgi:membrane peptidoglycan carboxypeptidase
MSNPAEYKENHGVSWTDGLTIQASIGQLDNSFSPLQLAAYCATVANNGVRLETHLLDHISDYARQTTVQEYTPVVAANTGISPETLQIVQQGMRQVVTGGTAASQFADYGIAVAAKTGTAEVPGHSDNVTFIAYAPYENPEIAVAVVLQYGASGTYSMQVAKDIFDAYFYGKTVNENGELVFPEEEPEELPVLPAEVLSSPKVPPMLPRLGTRVAAGMGVGVTPMGVAFGAEEPLEEEPPEASCLFSMNCSNHAALPLLSVSETGSAVGSMVAVGSGTIREASIAAARSPV